jgi:hypothetical protein
LIEFADVIEIIDVVAIAFGAAGFASGREPDVGDAYFVEVFDGGE